MAGKVCVVFGVGPGTGMSCVRKWAKEGFKVAMVSRTDSKLKDLAAKNPGTFPFAADVTDQASVNKALTAIESQLGDIHTVVYNAGNGVFGSYTSITMDKLDMAMKTNVHGLLAVAQHVGPKMEKRGEGVIVVTGATASLRGKPMTPGFATAKGAQRMLAQSLARDLGPKGVHCFYVIVDGSIGNDSGVTGTNESRKVVKGALEPSRKVQVLGKES